MTAVNQVSLGDHLKRWRQRRRMSQLDLAMESEMSARHLSFVETGRSRPSRDTVLRLARTLDVPLRGRNAMLLAAGFAPAYPERGLDHPDLAAARSAVGTILDAHAPFPALAVDRHWILVASNAAARALLAGVAPALVEPPINVLRVSLHPDGLSGRIVNLGEWKAHVLERLAGQIAASADPVLEELARELEAYPAPPGTVSSGHSALFVPLILDWGDTRLSFFSTTTVFGTPVEVTLAELAIEAFLPADEATARALHAAASMRDDPTDGG